MEPVAARISPSRWITEGWNLFLKDIGNFALIGIFSTLFLSVLPFIWGPVCAAMVFAAFRFNERGHVSLGDYFEGYRFFLPAFLAGLLITLLTLLGLILLIIPGLIVFSLYLFTFSYICHSDQDFWQAMGSSRRLASQDYFGFTMFALALILINFLGMLFFYVGLVFTLPVSACAVALAFRELHGLPAAPPLEAAPPAPPIVIE